MPWTTYKSSPSPGGHPKSCAAAQAVSATDHDLPIQPRVVAIKKETQYVGGKVMAEVPPVQGANGRVVDHGQADLGMPDRFAAKDRSRRAAEEAAIERHQRLLVGDADGDHGNPFGCVTPFSVRDI